ncbi:MAG: hypothetical protein HRU46_14220 [Verrucomicrobiales bacterium]|nr:hypothetical protein [Verrucomicrobiales bacterium]
MRDSEALPEGAEAALKVSGTDIPMVLVTTADGATSIRGISAGILKEGIRKAERELREHLETVDVVGSEG